MCARLAQLVISLAANQKVPSSIPGLVECRTLRDLFSPHRPLTGTSSRWCSFLKCYHSGLKRINRRTVVVRYTWEIASSGCYVSPSVNKMSLVYFNLPYILNLLTRSLAWLSLFRHNNICFKIFFSLLRVYSDFSGRITNLKTLLR